MVHSRTPKRTENADFKLDELKQYDRRQKHKLEEVLHKKGKNITQNVMNRFSGLT